jgi:hypothetical protein
MKRGARSLWSQQLKDEFGEVVRRDLYLRRNRSCFVERKNYKVFFLQVIRNGNQITIQANRVKIH